MTFDCQQYAAAALQRHIKGIEFILSEMREGKMEVGDIQGETIVGCDRAGPGALTMRLQVTAVPVAKKPPATVEISLIGGAS